MDKKIEIKQETIEKAVKCNSGHVCLSDHKKIVCEVSDIVGNEWLLLKRKPLQCNYFLNFGSGGFCQCPVRKEMYKQYHI